MQYYSDFGMGNVELEAVLVSTSLIVPNIVNFSHFLKHRQFISKDRLRDYLVQHEPGAQPHEIESFAAERLRFIWRFCRRLRLTCRYGWSCLSGVPCPWGRQYFLSQST
jgi:hypothetical protein